MLYSKMFLQIESKERHCLTSFVRPLHNEILKRNRITFYKAKLEALLSKLNLKFQLCQRQTTNS